MRPHGYLLIVAAALALLLPSSGLRSQLAPAPVGDPVQALQSLQKANEALLKRQADTLNELIDLTNTAREARILSKRG
jgi:hypothetical protein